MEEAGQDVVVYVRLSMSCAGVWPMSVLTVIALEQSDAFETVTDAI